MEVMSTNEKVSMDLGQATVDVRYHTTEIEPFDQSEIEQITSLFRFSLKNQYSLIIFLFLRLSNSKQCNNNYELLHVYNILTAQGSLLGTGGKSLSFLCLCN